MRIFKYRPVQNWMDQLWKNLPNICITLVKKKNKKFFLIRSELLFIISICSPQKLNDIKNTYIMPNNRYTLVSCFIKWIYLLLMLHNPGRAWKNNERGTQSQEFHATFRSILIPVGSKVCVLFTKLVTEWLITKFYTSNIIYNIYTITVNNWLW